MISFAKLRFQWLNNWMKNFVFKKNDAQSQLNSEEKKFEKIKITDINILLNRVKLTKKNELKKRIIFLFFLILSITLVCIFSLI